MHENQAEYKVPVSDVEQYAETGRCRGGLVPPFYD